MITTINLPTAARVLVIGQATAHSENTSSGNFHAGCSLVTNTGSVNGTAQEYDGTNQTTDSGAMVGITGVLAAGSHDFAVDCYDSGNTTFFDVGITAVAISPD